MSLYYSASIGGFYDDAINKEIPNDKIRITKEEHNQTLTHLNSNKIVEVIDGKIVLKNKLVPQIKKTIKQKKEDKLQSKYKEELDNFVWNEVKKNKKNDLIEVNKKIK